MSSPRQPHRVSTKPIQAAVTYEGRTFRFTHDDPQDHIFSILNRTGTFYESEMLHTLSSLLRRRDLVLDVGANIGTHSVFFAGVCGCRVVAFEPNPRAVESLRTNLRLNRLQKKVTIETVAVGATRQRGALVQPTAHNLGTGAVAHNPAGEIEIVPLDELAFDGKVALIKIDIEGNDVDVLRGAGSLLARDHPAIIIEARTAPEYAEAARLLDPLGYVAAGSFNYTPTHLFVCPAAAADAARSLRELGHRLSQQYIDSMSRQASVDQRLGRIGTHVADIASKGQADRTALSDRVDEMQRAVGSLGDSMSPLATVLQEQKAALENQLAALLQRAEADGNASRQLRAEIEARLDRLDLAVEQLAAATAETRVALGEDLSRHIAQQAAAGSEASGRLDAAIETLNDRQAGRETRLDVRLNETQSLIDAVKTSLTETLQAASEATAGSLTGLRLEVSQDIARQAAARSEAAIQLHATLDKLLDRQDRVEDRLDDARSHIDAVQTALRATLQAASDNTADALTSLEEKLSLQTSRLVAASNETADQLHAAIGTVHDRQTRVGERLDDARSHIDAVGSALLEKLQSASDATAADLVSLRQDVVQGNARQVAASTEGAERLNAAIGALHDRQSQLDTRLVDTHARIDAAQAALGGRLQSASDATAAGLAVFQQEIARDISAHTAASSETAVQLRAAIGEVRERQVEADGRLAGVQLHIDAIQTTLLERMQALSDSVAAGMTGLEQQISHHIARQGMASSKAADRLHAAIGRMQERQAQSDERVADVRTHVEAVCATLIGRIQSASDSIAAGLTGLESGVSSQLARRAAAQDEAVAQLGESLDALDRKSDATIEATLLGVASLEADLGQLRRKLGDAVEQRLDSYVKTIITGHLKQLRGEIARAIGQQFGELRVDLDALLGKSNMSIGDTLALLGIDATSAPIIALPEAKPPDPPESEKDLVVTVETLAQSPRFDVAAEVQKKIEDQEKLDIQAEGQKKTSASIEDQRRTWFVRRRTPPTVVAVEPPSAAVEEPAGKKSRAASTRREPSQRAAIHIAQPQSSGEIIAQFDFGLGWKDVAWGKKGTDLREGTLVVAVVDKVDLGFVTRSVKFPGGGLLEVEVTSYGVEGTATGRILQIRSEAGEPIGHDYPLDEGRTSVRAFATFRTKQIKVNIVRPRSELGTAYKVSSVTVRRIAADDHQAEVKAVIGQPILASMASIPSRRDTLVDSVNSLLAQCDRVRVFLNEYPEVPSFLDHPRIEVRRSQDWDDRGDAGKFFWMDRDENIGGYRLTVDDDLIYPPDFAITMARKVAAFGNKAIYSAHGVLLRQPIRAYYETSSRSATFHFASPLEVDRGVHIGGTGAMCFHADAVQMRRVDFKYCNSADIWISLFAQEKKLPLLTPARPRDWIRENRRPIAEETIYDHSLKRTRSRFDSSLVQDAAVRFSNPITLQVCGRAKCGLYLHVSNVEDLNAALRSWCSWRPLDVEWVVFLAFDKEYSGLETATRSTNIPHEVHLVEISSDRPVDMASMWEQLEVEAALCVSDTVRFSPHASQDGQWEATNGKVASTAEPLLAGQAVSHPRLAIRSLRAAGSGETSGFIVGRDTDRMNWLTDLVTEATITMGRSSLDAASFIGPKQTSAPRAVRAVAEHGYCLNDVFKRVIVLNLDRRPDRWQAVSRQFSRAGIRCERMSATDGSLPQVAAEYEAYRTLPLATVSADVPPVRYETELYLKYASQRARLAYIEGKSGRKSISSVGAWGYLRSYECILEQALADQTESMIVFDDDVVLHNDFRSIFAEAMRQLPDDWLILQLGTLQYNWSEPWVQWRSTRLYQTNGSAVGSHAVGMRFDVYPFLLDHVRRMDMPYDVGALSAATRAFPDRCFVLYPNLAIQRLADSDIGTSAFQKTRSMAEIAKTYRWNLGDYGLRVEQPTPETAQPLARVIGE